MITICIPVYNRADIVGRTLESILRQSYRPLNVVLVDNNSTDNTYEVINGWKAEHEDSQLKIDVLRETKPGACAARNAALEVSTTPWTMFFDSDDVMPSDHIEKIVDSIKEHPDADIIGWGRLIHYLNGSSIKRVFTIKNPIFKNITEASLATHNYIAKTSLFREVGGWDPTIKVGQDIEIGSRLLIKKPRLAFIPGHIVDIYETEESITNNQGIEQMIYTLKKIKNNLPKIYSHWVDLQIIIKAALKQNKSEYSKKIAKEAIESQPPIRKFLFKILYRYQKAGGRGTARIYSLIHFNRMA